MLTVGRVARRRPHAVALIGIVLAACVASPAPTPVELTAAQAAQSLCATKGLDSAGAYGNGALAAAYPSTASAVATWLRTGPLQVVGTTPWDQRDPSDPVAVCYYDGTFSGFPVPPGAKDVFDRLLLLVPQTGDPVFVEAGFESTLDLVAPAPS